MASQEFLQLKERCNQLIEKYLEPIIHDEKTALENSLQLPQPDFDSFAAFRFLTHAELEGYFESKAELALKALDADFKNNKVGSSKFASLIFLYLMKKQISQRWTASSMSDEKSIKNAERADFKNLAQLALGYGRQFIKQNNGIKENSVQTLSALMGYFEDELDSILINELNQHGISRGKVAHESWTKDTSIFESADIEKKRLLSILNLTEKFYENNVVPDSVGNKLTFLKKILLLMKFKY